MSEYSTGERHNMMRRVVRVGPARPYTCRVTSSGHVGDLGLIGRGFDQPSTYRGTTMSDHDSGG
jgi:hypothetical protein